ncbi:MAG: PilZ domain-containing protein [Candidatus Aureabacteria bacterium]|nr:PilZ domain-containing protein [Candidatus Auribacterota bacterium]
MDRVERRKCKRVVCDDVISYSVLQGNKASSVASSDKVRCKNISAEGILFASEVSFPLGTLHKLNLYMDSSKETPESISMVGEVLRCDKDKDGQEWNIAVSLHCIEKRKKDNFLSWLASKS